MKKVGILTINDNNNYGNRLQNYAVQKILEKYEIIPETIINTTRLHKNNSKIKSFLRNIKFNIKNYINPRRKYFSEFNNNITFSKIRINSKSIPKKLDKKYEFFVTGSDQVWNQNLKHFSGIDFLTFTSPEKKIAFSASIGVTELNDGQKEVMNQNLKDFFKISVREISAKEIINSIIPEKNVEVLIDPTMMLSAKEWDKVAKEPKQFNGLNDKKYILNYFLGTLSENRKSEIERIAKENDCFVINILDKNDPFYKTGPSEFLYLEKNAFLICTDSFHSSVFAILYNRPFVIFDRDQKVVSMNTRLDTLLSMFKLKNRKFNGRNITKENLNHDYSEAYKILERERKKSEQFIKKSFDIK